MDDKNSKNFIQPAVLGIPVGLLVAAVSMKYMSPVSRFVFLIAILGLAADALYFLSKKGSDE
ncbi:hypothetical protein [Butyrivibrio sp. XPD2002]|uniref:hypothetical protein n=1 Tax=Butyrivibrio sp. XPD2002 TaxID=1280665 RepID=UPI00047E7966|nr:hypothetical protein [Butyrivibrio sp. XPD2002]